MSVDLDTVRNGVLSIGDDTGRIGVSIVYS